MFIHHGTCAEPFYICHGGAGPMDPSHKWVATATDAIIKLMRGHKELLSRPDPLDIVIASLGSMEKDPLFNAGEGSALQKDGKARMSAAVMSSKSGTFSGVISATDISHPSMLAGHLQTSPSRVLTYPGTELLARALALPVTEQLSPRRTQQWLTKLKDEHRWDTVGVVVKADHLAAGTSTGGRGFEFPGRVSDSATVAGNYATSHCAVSATGWGEQIVDDGFCVRLETRVRDGMSLKDAAEKGHQEALDRGREYGFIAVDGGGNYAVATTTKAMTFAIVTASGKEPLASA